MGGLGADEGGGGLISAALVAAGEYLCVACCADTWGRIAFSVSDAGLWWFGVFANPFPFAGRIGVFALCAADINEAAGNCCLRVAWRRGSVGFAAAGAGRGSRFSGGAPFFCVLAKVGYVGRGRTARKMGCDGGRGAIFTTRTTLFALLVFTLPLPFGDVVWLMTVPATVFSVLFFPLGAAEFDVGADVNREDLSEGARKDARLETPKGPFPFFSTVAGAIPNNCGVNDGVVFFFSSAGALEVGRSEDVGEGRGLSSWFTFMLIHYSDTEWGLGTNCSKLICSGAIRTIANLSRVGRYLRAGFFWTVDW